MAVGIINWKDCITMVAAFMTLIVVFLSAVIQVAHGLILRQWVMVIVMQEMTLQIILILQVALLIFLWEQPNC